ncbi:MAG: putative manganese transporter [Bacilli bacterium]
MKSSIKHTLSTLIFILIITFILNIIFEFLGQELIAKIFLKESIFGPFIASLIGLIPNCGASIMITELYLNNAISLGSAIAGLLTGSGVAILVLFKTNKNKQENLRIITLIYGIGVLVGVLISLIEMII